MGLKERREAALAPGEIARHRADLAKASGRRRLDLILDARNPQALVRALPADELYLVIRDIGLADAAPLVQLASAEQFKVFLDLDAWRQNELDPTRAMVWLRAARAGSLDDPKAGEQVHPRGHGRRGRVRGGEGAPGRPLRRGRVHGDAAPLRDPLGARQRALPDRA